MALAEGSRVFLCYDLPPPVLWHERLVLSTCRCGRGWHIVLTPDGDVYPELISLENEDITGFRVQSVMGILAPWPFRRQHLQDQTGPGRPRNGADAHRCQACW